MRAACFPLTARCPISWAAGGQRWRLTVIYTWLYVNTAGSLFFVSIFHAMSNTIAFVLLEAGIFTSSQAGRWHARTCRA